MQFCGDVFRTVLTSRATPSLLQHAQPSSRLLPKSAISFLASQIQDTEDSFLSFPAGTKFLNPSQLELDSVVSSRGCGGLPLDPARVCLYCSWSPDFRFLVTQPPSRDVGRETGKSLCVPLPYPCPSTFS